jgi:hypothetical protein
MKIRLGLAAVFAAFIGFASGSAFANTIYNMDLRGGGSSAVGTITTDSTIGVLQTANLLDWQITLTTNSVTSSLHGSLDSQGFMGGSAVTATATGLFFDFSATDSSFLIFVIGASPFSNALCFNDARGICSGHPSLVLVGIWSEPFAPFSIGSGVQQIAAVAPTPVPAALPLFASAIGGLGFVGWRRERAV